MNPGQNSHFNADRADLIHLAPIRPNPTDDHFPDNVLCQTVDHMADDFAASSLLFTKLIPVCLMNEIANRIQIMLRSSLSSFAVRMSACRWQKRLPIPTTAGSAGTTPPQLWLADFAPIFAITAQICLIASWPNMMACSITSSSTSFAPASTIMIASAVPATTRSMSDSISCACVGLTRTGADTAHFQPPIGPSNGMSEMVRAARSDQCTNRRRVVLVNRQTCATICTSLRNPSGKSGLKACRSFARPKQLPLQPAFSRPHPPGIFPPNTSFFIIDDEGKKSISARGCLDMVAVTKTTVFHNGPKQLRLLVWLVLPLPEKCSGF